MGALVGWYCLSYSVANPFSFFNSSIVDPVLSPIVGMNIHLCVCQALAQPLRRHWAHVSMHFLASAIVTRFSECIWDGSPSGTVCGWPFLQYLLHTLSRYILMLEYFVPTSKRDWSIYTLVFLLEFHVVWNVPSQVQNWTSPLCSVFLEISSTIHVQM